MLKVTPSALDMVLPEHSVSEETATSLSELRNPWPESVKATASLAGNLLGLKEDTAGTVDTHARERWITHKQPGP